LLIDTISIDKIGVNEKIKAEVERVKKFHRYILGDKELTVTDEIDIRTYAKYLLKEGADIEKRELLGCLRSKIILNNKRISLISNRD
jgi:hypothetical protein